MLGFALQVMRETVWINPRYTGGICLNMLYSKVDRPCQLTVIGRRPAVKQPMLMDPSWSKKTAVEFFSVRSFL